MILWHFPRIWKESPNVNSLKTSWSSLFLTLKSQGLIIRKSIFKKKKFTIIKKINNVIYQKIIQLRTLNGWIVCELYLVNLFLKKDSTAEHQIFARVYAIKKLILEAITARSAYTTTHSLYTCSPEASSSARSEPVTLYIPASHLLSWGRRVGGEVHGRRWHVAVTLTLLTIRLKRWN